MRFVHVAGFAEVTEQVADTFGGTLMAFDLAVPAALLASAANCCSVCSWARSLGAYSGDDELRAGHVEAAFAGIPGQARAMPNSSSPL